MLNTFCVGWQLGNQLFVTHINRNLIVSLFLSAKANTWLFHSFADTRTLYVCPNNAHHIKSPKWKMVVWLFFSQFFPLFTLHLSLYCWKITNELRLKSIQLYESCVCERAACGQDCFFIPFFFHFIRSFIFHILRW